MIGWSSKVFLLEVLRRFETLTILDTRGATDKFMIKVKIKKNLFPDDSEKKTGYEHVLKGLKMFNKLENLAL